MNELIIWSLTVYGISNILVVSTLFKPVRSFLKPVPVLGKILTCMMCCGFWIGLGVGLLYTPTSFISTNLYIGMILSGALGSALTWILHVIVTCIVKITENY